MTTRKPFIEEEPSEEIKCQFSSPQWASDLFQDPAIKAITNESRVIKPLSTADTFCAVTLNTPSTISACQNFYRDGTSPNGFREMLSVLKLGSGLNGHIDTCHGGFVSLLLDEAIGTAAEYERPEEKSTMTAYLKVDYKKPVLTPSTVLCRSWLEKKEGRKLWARGTVEDGEGGVLAAGEALFVVVEKRTPREKL